MLSLSSEKLLGSLINTQPLGTLDLRTASRRLAALRRSPWGDHAIAAATVGLLALLFMSRSRPIIHWFVVPVIACGILAGGVFMQFSTHMAFSVYLRDVMHSMVLRDVMTGLVKSLAFATIIVQVGCLEGFRVRGGPDAVGRSATAAVVKSTFLVILADVGFTAIFYLTGGK